MESGETPRISPLFRVGESSHGPRGSICDRSGTQELTDRLLDGPVAGLVEQIDRATVADNRLYPTRFLTIGNTVFEPGLLDHAKEQGQVAAGRIAVGADVFRVEIVILGMRSQPTHGTLAIFQCRREGRFAQETI